MIIQSNNPQLPRGSIGFALGIAGMLVSLYYSIAFISGNATGAELVAGIVFALVMDYAKVALGSEALIALVQFRLLSAVVYTLIVISLYALSMFSATFMLSANNNDTALQFHTSQATTLQADIAAKRAELDKCPPGVMTKCINPRTAELNLLQNKLELAQAVSNDIKNAQKIATTWEKFAHVIGDTPDSLQVKLAFFRAFLLEIIAPILVSLFLAYYRNRTPKVQQERIVNQQEPEQPKVQVQAAPLQVQQPPKPTVTTALPQYKTSFKDLKW